MIKKFKEALHEIMTTEEIDRIIKYAPFLERRGLKRFKKAYLEYGEGVDRVSLWVTLTNINSAALFRDIITYMVSKDDE